MTGLNYEKKKTTGGRQLSIYCRKENINEWDSIPKNQHAQEFNQWLKERKTQRETTQKQIDSTRSPYQRTYPEKYLTPVEDLEETQ